MRLYLSSYGLGAARETLRTRHGDASCGVVLNALDHFGPTRDRDLPQVQEELADLGYRAVELDLREFFGCPPELGRRLQEVDLLWVVGGNAFVLGRAAAASGLRSAIDARRRSDRPFTYGGFSAGACLAGPDLTGVDLVDDPTVTVDRYPQTAPKTLGLVEFRIVPHWRSDHPESDLATAMAARLDHLALKYRPLRDGDVITGELRNGDVVPG